MQHFDGTDAGFTLLELMVVLVIAGMLFLCLEEGVHFGLSTLDTQQLKTADLENKLVVDGLLRSLMASLDAGVQGQERVVTGTQDGLMFRAHLDASTSPVPEADMTLFAEKGWLLLRWSLHQQAIRVGPPLTPHLEKLRPGVKKLTFSYWSSHTRQWSSGWHSDAPPDLVRVHLEFVSPNEYWPDLLVAPMRDRAD